MSDSPRFASLLLATALVVTAHAAAFGELLVYEPFAGVPGQKLDCVPPWQPTAAATDRLELGAGSLPIPTVLVCTA